VLSLTSQQLPQMCGDAETDRLRIQRHLFYNLSKEFVKKSSLRVDEFERLLARQPSYRVLLGCDAVDPDIEKQSVKRLKAFCEKLSGIGDFEATPVDFFDVCSLVCPLAHSDPGLCKAFRAGMLVTVRSDDNPDVDLLLLDGHKQFAKAFLDKLADYARLGKHDVQTGQPSAGFVAISRYPANNQVSIAARVDDSAMAVVVGHARVASTFANKVLDSLRQGD